MNVMLNIVIKHITPEEDFYMEKSKIEEVLKETLDRIQFWIGNVDAKISFLLSLSGIILGFIFASETIDNIIKGYFNLDVTGLRIWIAIINGIILIGSVFYISKAIIHFLIALKGRIDPKEYRQYKVEVKSLIFWRSIADINQYVDYKKRVDSLDEETMINDLQSQVYINSKITKEKFIIYNKGVRFLSVGIVLLIVFKIIGYIPI